MRGGGYRRPRLCRLCECPAVDGGVRLRKPNMERLSRWTKAHWDTDIRIEQKNHIVCHFCVGDLRFLEEHSVKKEPSDQLWWPRYEKHNDVHREFYKYYADEWIKPCSVKMTPLANEDILLKEYSQKGFGQRHRCLFCPQSYVAHQNLVDHVKTVHFENFFYCNRINCGKLFHTEEEKAEHTEKEHQIKKESLKCVYCGKVSTNKANHKYHLLKRHRSQIIRCPNVHCKVMFKTKEERDIHVNNFHNSGKYFCCFCDIYFECHKTQWNHMKVHTTALKCNLSKNCPNYFKTEEERQKHVEEKHSNKFKCIYCNQVSYGLRRSLSTHIKDFHKDVALRCEYTHQCSTWFKTEEERQKHYEEDHEMGEDKVLCPICNKRFSFKAGIIGAHFRTHHKKEKIIKCDYALYCSNYFKSEEEKLKHIREVHEIHDEKFRCIYCDKLFPQYLAYHIEKWHKKVAIKCNFHVRCPNYFKTLEDREKHVREVHQAEKVREAAPCLYCDKILAGRNTLNAHINLKHSEIAIKCQHPQCGTYFKSQEDLENHFSSKPKHNQPLKKKELLIEPFICAFCKKSFHYKSGLKQHIISKHRRTKEVCPHCKKQTSSKRDHIMSDICKVCNQKFRCLCLLRSHTLKCRPVFHCPVCSKSFKIQSALTYHCKTNHTVFTLKWKGVQFESRGFKCDDCLTFFSSIDGLQTHTRLWHKSTNVTCDFCKKKSANKLSVKYHILRTHLRLTKYYFQCPVCNLKLDREIALKNHMGKHLTKKFVQCQICDKVMQPCALKLHIKFQH